MPCLAHGLRTGIKAKNRQNKAAKVAYRLNAIAYVVMLCYSLFAAVCCCLLQGECITAYAIALCKA